MTLQPKWLQNFMRRPSRADLLARVKQLTEERDVFEERVYDSQWHLERARNELADAKEFKKMLSDEAVSTEKRLTEWRQAAKELVQGAQASSNSTRKMLEERIAELGDLPSKHVRAMAELHAERTELALTKDVIESLRGELAIANQYKPLYLATLVAKKPRVKK